MFALSPTLFLGSFSCPKLAKTIQLSCPSCLHTNKIKLYLNLFTRPCRKCHSCGKDVLRQQWQMCRRKKEAFVGEEHEDIEGLELRVEHSYVWIYEGGYRLCGWYGEDEKRACLSTVNNE
ncbi:hypothetical protein BGZ60DRAFT_259050 [Tricladium varicosporioides]|nr:hypothetical protein BGZ60DRAFT_259050 [Hymenoscyphus varicosporioides]